MAKSAEIDIETLAGATWIMAASTSFIDGEWGQKDLEAFADILQQMHDNSKSKVVRDVAAFHANDERAEAVVGRGIRNWREDLAESAKVLEKAPVADAIRFIHWTVALGKAVALAQNSGGWIRGSKPISPSQSKVIGNCALPLIGKKALKELLKGPDVNPLNNINHWVEEHGA
jgi:hypothetical protein